MAETYKKFSHREHILELPDTYIGSVETSEDTRWVYDAAEGKMSHRKLKYNPGFYKIFDEIIVNARDALVRSQQDESRIPVKRIDITVGQVDGKFTVTVKNDGDGIPIQQHETEKCWIPELIFGHLLTSSNYDKQEEKIVGGKNGYGQKCLEYNTKIPQWDGTIKTAKDIVIGDKLIGDDGTIRTVKSVCHGTGQMFEVEQANADSYTVNDQHILTLYMPDHKVILWNETKNGWSVLWWNHEEKCINQKTMSFKPTEITCEECNSKLSGNLGRHYRRVHKGVPIPKYERKSPTMIAPNTPEVQAARRELEEFCKSIPDNAVFDMSIQDYMKLSATTKKRLAGVRGQCVQWPKREIALDPYILGLWLGDGMKGGRHYACYGEKDPELIQAFEEWGLLNDAVILKKEKYVYQISSKSRFGKKGSSPLRKLLKQYNLVDNKHVPMEYIVNDRETRLQVLAGLIDTDGYVSRNGTRVNISQGLEHEAIITGILHLARSLGFCCQITRNKTSWTYKDEKRTGEAYYINISGEHLGDIPTRLPRKKCANSVVRKTSTSTGFLTVKDAGIDKYVGISIDGNERFVLNDFTVTHNCTNVYSDSFKVGIRDPKTGLKYEQGWKKNMSVCEKPHITKDKASKGFVEVTYIPDISRFQGLSLEDMTLVLHTRTIELAALAGKDVKITWNGEEVKVDTFEKFVRLFLRADAEKCLAYERCGPRWEVAAVLTRNLFSEDLGTPDDRHISFVNGINTRKGGKHVETVQRHVLGDICEVATKKKKMDLKPGQIKDTVTFFVNATIVNPAFDSQTKETLTTPVAKFGSTVTISPKFTDALVKAGVLEEAQAILNAKQARDTKKTDGAKKRTIYGLPKLEDALLAGTAKSSECTLILTEGDSAATSAIAGLKVVGRERWGIFPLKGKMLNVKDISRDKFNSNEELTAIKKILGLEQGKKYKDTSSLRYGRVLIMSDQDVDGFHIRGLLMNLFHTEWPELMHMGFLCSLMTPLVKMTRGNETLAFYSDAELETWKDRVGADVAAKYKSKYYKGLGTSTPAEAREWFENLSDIRYDWDDGTDQTMNLAFSKKLSDERKTWLATYDPKRSVEPTVDASGKKHVAYSRFVHDELIHFSNADNLRSLPHIMDGLKPSQRKILFGCFKRNLRSEIRVAQLAGYVSEHAAYHHGEASLNQTITGMAQIFVGANNINLLTPHGQFGCLAPDTPILMWDGSTKRADDVCIGDILIGDDGTPRNVIKTTSGVDEMYKITMRDNEYTVNSQHIITLYYPNNNKIKWKTSSNLWYINYFDGSSVKSVSITVKDNNKHNKYNTSQLTKEDGYNKMIEKQRDIAVTYNTSDFIDIKIIDYLKVPHVYKKSMYMISNINTIQWNKQIVPIDPYIFGVWLGDGDQNGHGITSADYEILQSFALYADSINCEMTHHTNGKNHENYHYGIRRKQSGYKVSIGDNEHSSIICDGCKTSSKKSPICDWHFDKSDCYVQYYKSQNGQNRTDMNPFKNILKNNNLYKNKHIPDSYIYNDKETRLQLLAGIIDTDGTIKKNGSQQYVEISQCKRVHENLIKSIDYIAKSLGFSTSITTSRTDKFTKKGHSTTILTLRIMGKYLHEIPTKLHRKKINNNINSRIDHYHNYYKFDIQSIGSGPFNGWQVDKNERFLLGNFIVTHNSRLLGGKDAASPRYIHTHLESIVDTIYKKDDGPILKHLDDDGDIVEPETYLPVVPMIAINGSVGIGTGFSTDIPPHNPREVVGLLKNRIAGETESLAGKTLNPWWVGFKGAVEKKDDKMWVTHGIYEWQDATCSVKITELPVGTWTKDYKVYLDTMIQGGGADVKAEEKPAKKAAGKKGDDASSVSEEKKRKAKSVLKSFEDLYNDVDVNFVLYLDSEYYKKAKENVAEFEKLFHLVTSWKTTNMCCFDTNMNIVKYDTIGDIMEKFYTYRLAAYERRRQHQIGEIKDTIEELDAKYKFIKAIVEGRLKIMNEEDSMVLGGLRGLGLPPRSDRKSPETLGAYEYLLRMRVDRIKKASIAESEAELVSAKKKLAALEATTPAALWLKELDEFLESWEVAEANMLQVMSASSEELVPKKKKVVRKTK